MQELNPYRFNIPFDDEGTFHIEREFCSDIIAFAFAAVNGAVKVEKFDYLNAKWEQNLKVEIDPDSACTTLAEWFNMDKYIDATMLDAIATGIIALKEVQLQIA